ncbi:hypothetical protein TTHERM_01179920 (macronuclear) [Tetrahymena thermophila SB210]|uniref:Uncharacterized protein n=1 Tax=Tetrahymena thermophila (strain SB210) TaxID=312017 RepID=Q22AN3_TETTS|nr:hypothetical protein TTHERM_01179920 [Tetrahymena thermophila SB210]EAR82361.1 hypothetical protein TTHERM_01179920 [Tetrahymena thermophila SB210]|eukprot:XP_001030024.1 hypothetical protein TTHERM_01179920 [Tetrahymena thermophila SB210]
MSSSIRCQQYPYQNSQLDDFIDHEIMQNKCEDSFFNGHDDNLCGSALETPTPNPDYCEQLDFFDHNQQQYLQHSNQQGIQSQFQTMPYSNNIKLYGYEQQFQNQSNLHLMQYNQADSFIKSDQIQAKSQIDDYSEHQKYSDQSTDAQIQSQQDKIDTNQKEKVKTGNQSTFLNKLIDQLFQNVDIPEDQISQLNDEERAIFQSMKSQCQSQQESITPNPAFMKLDKEDISNQENFSEDLLNLDMEIEQNKSQFASFQLQSDQPIQYNVFENNYHQNLPNQKAISQKKQKQNSFKSNQACSHSNSQKNKKKQKRVEEMQKMIFKKSFKYVENQYFRERINKSRISSKDKDNLKFYEDYFGKTAQEHQIPLKNFYHPQKQIKKGQKTKENTPGQKSFNQAYISLILKSDSFRKKVQYYIDNLILEQIQQERKSKIAKVIANLKKKYQQIEKELQKKNNSIAPFKLQTTPQSDISYYWESTKESEDNQPDEVKAQIKSENFKNIVSQLEDCIQTNSKIKLPWTNIQIQQAIQLAQRTIIQADEDC